MSSLSFIGRANLINWKKKCFLLQAASNKVPNTFSKRHLILLKVVFIYLNDSYVNINIA